MASDPLGTRIAAALARGDTTQAMQLMREAGGRQLKDAMAGVEAYAARDAERGDASVQAALQQGKPIEAIKRLREAHPGMDLKSAKAAVDAMRRDASMQASHAKSGAVALLGNATRPPTVADGDRAGSLAVVIALAAAVVALALWIFGG